MGQQDVWKKRNSSVSNENKTVVTKTEPQSTVDWFDPSLKLHVCLKCVKCSTTAITVKFASQ